MALEGIIKLKEIQGIFRLLLCNVFVFFCCFEPCSTKFALAFRWLIHIFNRIGQFAFSMHGRQSEVYRAFSLDLLPYAKSPPQPPTVGQPEVFNENIG